MPRATLDRRPAADPGRLRLDAGAVRVLREQGRSLLPVGVRGWRANSSAEIW